MTNDTVRISGLVGLLVLLLAPGGTACHRPAKNLPFGAACGSDDDCSSSICLFPDHQAKQGSCTKSCDMDKNDCPPGKACATIADHAGKSVPVCGEPPPVGMPPQEGPSGLPPGGLPPGVHLPGVPPSPGAGEPPPGPAAPPVTRLAPPP